VIVLKNSYKSSSLADGKTANAARDKQKYKTDANNHTDTPVTNQRAADSSGLQVALHRAGVQCLPSSPSAARLSPFYAQSRNRSLCFETSQEGSSDRCRTTASNNSVVNLPENAVNVEVLARPDFFNNNISMANSLSRHTYQVHHTHLQQRD